MTPLEQLGLTIPIVQAPMAGVSTPEMAAAVSNAGGLGSIGVGATDAAGALTMIEATRARTDRPYNVNLFVHAAAQSRPVRDQAWLDAMRPLFERFDAETPTALHMIYKSFADDDEMLAMLVEAARRGAWRTGSPNGKRARRPRCPTTPSRMTPAKR